ncbi:hypothetical protein OFN42_40240, partial [Escherichia coli]|nr:hypothetical protein [Escherichia coli]
YYHSNYKWATQIVSKSTKRYDLAGWKAIPFNALLGFCSHRLHFHRFTDHGPKNKVYVLYALCSAEM